MPDRFVLDSFALLSLLQAEPGAARVDTLIEQANTGGTDLFISVVNLGEVFYTVENRRGLQIAQETLAAIDQSPIQMVDVDLTLALSASRLKSSARLGYLDCFTAALAQHLDAIVVTGDPDFKKVEAVVSVEWLPG
jgi:ribonuclease VapC